MSVNNRDVASLWDMVQAIRDLRSFTGNLSSFEEYAESLLIQRAVEGQLEIVGEAARRLSDEFCHAHPEIDWAGLVGLRNVLAHRYDQVRADRI